jgi:hypothetical protein
VPSDRNVRISSQAARRARIEAGRWLVEEDELGIPDEGDTEVEASLLASRERLHSRVPLLGEADELDDLVHVARVGEVAGEQPVRLAYGQEWAQLRLLEDDAHPFPELARRIAGIEAEHGRASAVALAVALQDLDRRRLARAVRTEEPEHLALRDVEADAVERLHVPVRLRQVRDRDRVRHGRRRYAPGGAR